MDKVYVLRLFHSAVTFWNPKHRECFSVKEQTANFKPPFIWRVFDTKEKIQMLLVPVLSLHVV